MVLFLPASELKSVFGIFGHFYSVPLAPGVIAECRSVLEIIRFTELPSELNKISTRRPDAVFIMMNPGSSRPLVQVEQHVPAAQIHQLTTCLVPTHPDTTQYQVMRIMHYCGWQHVRVLNLSDLRCTKSPLFFKQFEALEEAFAFDSHSIFATSRRTELTAKITRSKAVPIIRAWGVSPRLDPLIARCMSSIPSGRSLGGLLKEGTPDKYLHPLPSLQSQQQQWVDRMLAQVQSGW